MTLKALFAACVLLAGCCPNPVKPLPNPLVESSCPEISAPSDDSFGATTYTLVQQAGQYRKCRAAALGGGAK